MEYLTTYRKRLNRYGTNYQERTQTEREKLFALYLKKTIYRVSFTYNENLRYASLEPYRQDETKILHYLLTPISEELEVGDIILATDQLDQTARWLIYYKEDIAASGYNRYIVLKVTHLIECKNKSTNDNYSTYAYFYGQEDNMLKDELKSRSRSSILYNENLKLSFFICPLNNKIKKEDYFEISVTDKNNITVIESYRVTGFDKISTPGIEFVSVDPIYNYDNTPAPQKTPQDNDDNFFWIQGSDT